MCSEQEQRLRGTGGPEPAGHLGPLQSVPDRPRGSQERWASGAGAACTCASLRFPSESRFPFAAFVASLSSLAGGFPSFSGSQVEVPVVSVQDNFSGSWSPAVHVHMCVFSSLFSQDMDQISKPKMEKLFEALLIHLSLLISHFEEGKVHDLHIVTICSKKSVNI